MRRLAIDTNVFVAFARGEEGVLGIFGQAETIMLPVAVVGELLSGFRGGRREAENRALLDRFLSKPDVVVPTAGAETAEVYGEVKDALRRAGTPIPINDVWIAAQCIEHGAVLLSRDGHFDRVAGLRRVR